MRDLVQALHEFESHGVTPFIERHIENEPERRSLLEDWVVRCRYQAQVHSEHERQEVNKHQDTCPCCERNVSAMRLETQALSHQPLDLELQLIFRPRMQLQRETSQDIVVLAGENNALPRLVLWEDPLVEGVPRGIRILPELPDQIHILIIGIFLQAGSHGVMPADLGISKTPDKVMPSKA